MLSYIFKNLKIQLHHVYSFEKVSHCPIKPLSFLHKQKLKDNPVSLRNLYIAIIYKKKQITNNTALDFYLTSTTPLVWELNQNCNHTQDTTKVSQVCSKSVSKTLLMSWASPFEGMVLLMGCNCGHKGQHLNSNNNKVFRSPYYIEPKYIVCQCERGKYSRL